MDAEPRAENIGLVVSLDTYRDERKSRLGNKRPLTALIPFKPKTAHGDAGLREAEGQLSFIDLALDVEERISAEDGPERWASSVAYQAQRTVREQRIARYLGEAEGARRYIFDHPASGGSGAAVKLRLALSHTPMSPEAERLVRDALKAIAPPKRAVTGHDGAA
jgi:hypothetical protein